MRILSVILLVLLSISLLACNDTLTTQTLAPNAVSDVSPTVSATMVTFYGEELPVEEDELIYVIDVSGSMDWGHMTYTDLDGTPATGSQLDRAKVELIRSIQGLSEDLRFNIVSYNCESQSWEPELRHATPDQKASAAAWVEGLRARGGAGTGPAVMDALEYQDNRTIVLLSNVPPGCRGNTKLLVDDGPLFRGVNGFGGHLRMITSANNQEAKIHTFGIGAYGQFESFLRSIAQGTGGNYIPVN